MQPPSAKTPPPAGRGEDTESVSSTSERPGKQAFSGRCGSRSLGRDLKGQPVTGGVSGRRARSINFMVYCLTISLIIGITYASGLLLLAPPYGVTAYLATFERRSRFSTPENIVASYAVVIVSTEVLQSLYGHSAIAILLNVLIVSVFISFTTYEHPPAIALTMFSYIVHTTAAFILASIAILIVIVAIRSASGRLERKYLFTG